MVFKFTIIALLVTSVLVSCQKEQRLTTNTGFYSFKERSYTRNTTTYTDWTYDSVEVYEPAANTLAVRHIFDGLAWDSVKIISSNSGQLGFFNGFFPHFTINPSTNIITNAYNILPDDGRGREAFLDSGFVSRYDATTKTYYLHYFMAQRGRPDIIFHDTLIALP